MSAMPGSSRDFAPRSKFGPVFDSLVAFTLFAVIWQLASLAYPAFKVPGWERIFEALAGLQYGNVLVSLARVIAALVISFILGMAIALAMYMFEFAERLGTPLLNVIMAVPATCWIVFSILWFKGLELRICFVLVIVCGPIFVVDFLDGMRSVSKDLGAMVWSFRPGKLRFVRTLLMPAITPIVITSLKINLGQAIRLVTFAELVGAASGIGYGLTVAQELFSVAEVFAWTVVLVVILTIAMESLALIEKRLLRWRG
jgi:NitT/TauT family transport system permease protein